MSCAGSVRSVVPMHDAVLAALGDPATYGDGCGTVERHETHGSWVFVAGEHALKVKKPVVLRFLDYGTLERRRAMCREEVRINRRLAPDLYEGTVAIVALREGGVALDRDDEAPGAVEVGVLMRRYDERDTLAARWAAGSATPEQLRAVGARLAAFHAAQPRPREAEPALGALLAAVRTTLDDLDDGADTLDRPRVRALRCAMEAVLAARREELRLRGRRGLVVDGHGDLRSEHVLLTDPLQVVDAVEFDPALRIVDVACDLGFLVMDLEGAGAHELAAALVEGYRHAGGEPGDSGLLAAMACYRALVRVKVDLVRAGQDDAAAAARARVRLAQATSFAWRARGPELLAVCGPPASGKTTVARALCAASGMAHVSSDVVRKARAGLAPSERTPESAYGLAATLATYREVGAHAAAALAAGRGAVIDATLGDPAARDALRKALCRAARGLRYVECRVPAEEAMRRARAREDDPASESDATDEIAARLAAAWAPLDEVSADRHLVVRADRAVGEVVLEVAAWLDRAQDVPGGA
jgi:aminoglycoside phosphotransferase family enzyme/predicted kinase